MGNYRVTVKRLREYSATIHIRARSVAEANRKALDAFCDAAFENGQVYPLGLPPPWVEHDSVDYDAVIDTTFCCVDCGEDKDGEYYMVSDEL